MSSDRDKFLKLLQGAIQKDASDIHLKTGSVPYYRVDGLMEPQEGEALQYEDLEDISNILLSEDQKRQLLRRGEIDLAFTEKGLGRFRVNIFRQRGTLSFVMRRINSKLLTFKHVKLPPDINKSTELAR